MCSTTVAPFYGNRMARNASPARHSAKPSPVPQQPPCGLTGFLRPSDNLSKGVLAILEGPRGLWAWHAVLMPSTSVDAHLMQCQALSTTTMLQSKAAVLESSVSRSNDMAVTGQAAQDISSARSTCKCTYVCMHAKPKQDKQQDKTTSINCSLSVTHAAWLC